MLTKDDKKKLDDVLINAKKASLKSAQLNTELKNKILLEMATAMRENAQSIIKANKKDMTNGRKKKLSKALLDRLQLSEERIDAMARSVEEIAALPDPVGETLGGTIRPNGINLTKVRTPLGVIAIVYEARPNVTSDCVALCLKSSNVVILRGGTDAFNSNKAIVKVLKDATKKHVKEEVFFFVENTERESVDYLLKKGEGYIDLAIPRGGKGLIKKVVSVSRVPVIKHYEGVCHVYVDEFADLVDAVEIAYNSKVQRPSVCNSMECLLVHKEIAQEFLPLIAEKYQEAGVEIRGCAETAKIIDCVKAKKTDYGKEFLDLIVAVKVVETIDDAIDHINENSSGHTESIVSLFSPHIKQFTDNVHSACVFANMSTRFSDGGEFGLGAEMGISTDKLHARGPMGIQELTTYKYVAYGDGQVRG